MDDPPILEIRGLEKRYGAVTALAGIDLAVPRGAIYGFIGPNGAGKTTTIRIIAGLVRPTAGAVTLHGHDLASNRLAAARGLRTLVEVPAFYGHLSGRENLAIHARLAGAPLDEVDRLLARVALDEASRRRVGGYSLGMRQRLGIAQALVGRPDLVVLDEPMNGLDPAGMREMRRLIREERDRHGVTFLISSHLLWDVQHLCDEIGILHRGRMVAEGRIDTLLASAVSGFQVQTADNARALDRLRRDLADVPVRVDEDGTLIVEGGEEVLGRLHAVLLEADLAAREIHPMRASLEKYFLEKTEGVIG